MKRNSLNTKQSGAAHLIAIVAVVVVLIGGIGAYVVLGGSKDKDANPGQNTQQNDAASNFVATKAITPSEIKTLIAAVKAGTYDAKCTLDYGEGLPKSQSALTTTGPATLYLSGAKKMRLDATIESKPSHFMRVDTFVYLWADGNPKGSKIPVSTKSSSSSASSADSFAKNAEKYKMKCESAASLDNALFTPPTNVTFTEYNNQT